MEYYIIILIIFLIFTGLFGLIFNVWIIATTILRPKLQENNYVWFVCSTALTNSVYCANNVAPQAIAIVYDLDPNGLCCTIIGFILVWVSPLVVCSQALVAINRFYHFYHPQKALKLFTPKRCALILGVLYASMFAYTVISYFLGYIGRMMDGACGPRMDRMTPGRIVYMLLPFSVAYNVCLFCCHKIKRLIKAHQAAMSRQNVRTDFQEEREIVRLISVEIFVPVCLETPFLVCAPLTSAVYIPNAVISMTGCLYLTHLICDPIILVYIMKIYRYEFLRQFRTCRSKIFPSKTTPIAVEHVLY